MYCSVLGWSIMWRWDMFAVFQKPSLTPSLWNFMTISETGIHSTMIRLTAQKHSIVWWVSYVLHHRNETHTCSDLIPDDLKLTLIRLQCTFQGKVLYLLVSTHFNKIAMYIPGESTLFTRQCIGDGKCAQIMVGKNVNNFCSFPLSFSMSDWL